MFSNSKVVPYPVHVKEYFYLSGVHYIKSNNKYYQSFTYNKFGFISFDKTRNFYEKISKKEYLNKKQEFNLHLELELDIRKRIQLVLF